jgi:hypothetical protein
MTTSRELRYYREQAGFRRIGLGTCGGTALGQIDEQPHSLKNSTEHL